MRAKGVVGADPCVCPELHPSTHISKRVTTEGYPCIWEFKVVGADPWVCPEPHPSTYISKRVTTGGYPYIYVVSRRATIHQGIYWRWATLNACKQAGSETNMIVPPVPTVKRMGSLLTEHTI